MGRKNKNVQESGTENGEAVEEEHGAAFASLAHEDAPSVEINVPAFAEPAAGRLGERGRVHKCGLPSTGWRVRRLWAPA